ncbi:MAG: hypothetical protein COW02_03405 [Comamonadaceae bacterium CG12_big_fil_rev_8_21_14_0_65_59_15]|nr:MAG: hypothetical protein COW02_03405 [Comamonadaceae bacterium CG12_big_fil_rev_8_21_14_0_65_59_15]
MAAKDFYKSVRIFAEVTKPWEPHLSYETKPDERFDLSLVSQRVYGRRDEFLTVMAAAGMDMFDQPMLQKRLTLPNESQLYAMKRSAGFESIADYRENFAPTWGV